MNIIHHLRFIIICLFISQFIACSKGSDTVSPATYTDPETIPTTSNTMIFSVDGSAITIDQAFPFKGIHLGDTMSILVGADTTGKGTGLNLLGVHMAGTYPIGTEDTTGGNIQEIEMDYTYFLGGDTVVYLTPRPVPGSPAVGTLKVTELTSTIKATFHATLNKTKGIAGAPTIKIAGGVNAVLPN